MYKSWVEWIDKQKRAHSKTSNVQITAKKIKEWLSSNFCQQLTNWSLTGHHQKWNAKVTMTNCHPRVLWFWPTEFLGAVLYSTLSLWIMSRSPSWQKQSQSLWLHSQVCVCVYGGRGVLQISSDRDYRRIFLGLKFLIPVFFGYSNNLNICSSANVSGKLRLRNLARDILRAN